MQKKKKLLLTLFFHPNSSSNNFLFRSGSSRNNLELLLKMSFIFTSSILRAVVSVEYISGVTETETH